MKSFKFLGPLLCAAVLAAGCGGGSDTLTGQPAGGGGTGGGGTGGGTTPPPATLEIGATVNGTFTQGAVATTIPTGSQLAAGGSTQLTVEFREAGTGAPATEAITVNFSSSCPAGTVSFETTSGQPASSATTVNGQATLRYRYVGGCTLTQDTVVARVTQPPVNLPTTQQTAQVALSLAQSQVGSIQFVSASPANIGLQGTGRVDTSVVTFRVVDQAGGPRPNATVTFQLDTTAGGITLTPQTATTGSDGTATTTVRSGTVATVVRVTATTQGPSGPVSTTSSALTVSTGLPVANRFSIAVQPCSNVEAFSIDGVNVPVTARLFDRFGNPVPDGTSVSFTSELGGGIVGSCNTQTTANGANSGFCTVNWTSGGQRPGAEGPVPGRVTLLATAIGEEPFADANGNGLFDAGETFTDLSEPFRDENENGTRDSNEYFLDFDFATRPGYNGATGDGLFNGLLCTAGTACGSSTTGIGASNLIVMSTGAANISGVPSSHNFASGSLVVQAIITDLNGNALASGTTVTASASRGTLANPSNFTIGCSQAFYAPPNGTLVNGVNRFVFSVAPPTSASPGSGTFTIEVKSPSGVTSFVSTTLTGP